MKKDNEGYTLAELLAVTAILVILSSLVTGILFSVLRGSNKTMVTNAVSQNGQHALSVISSLMTNSLGLVSITEYSGIPPHVGYSGCSATGGPYARIITVKGFESGAQTAFTCDTTGKITSNSAELTDITSVQVGPPVNSSTCYFRCIQANSFTPPQIEIYFKLSQAGTSSLIERIASSEFKTSVTLRNYKP